MAMGNPTASAMTTKRTAEFGISKKREHLGRELREEPCDDSVSDRCAVNIAPLQLGQKVRRIHSARVDKALVTAALYLDARDLKSASKVPRTTSNNIHVTHNYP
jgi:hypothetical protein